MTDACTIGPVSVLNAHLVDGDEYSVDTEKFEIFCTQWQYRQLQGLVDTSYNEQGTIGVTILSGTNPWTPTYINTASDFDYDDDRLIHKGWYIIIGLSHGDLTADGHIECSITAIKLSSYLNEYLTMNFTTGVLDGTTYDTTYSNVTTTTLLDDTFTSFDSPTTWNAKVTDMGTSSIAASGGSLVFSGLSSTNGIYKACWTQTANTYAAPFTAETDLVWSVRAASSSTPHLMRFLITPKTCATQNDMNKDSVMIQIFSSNNTTWYTVYTNSPTGSNTAVVSSVADNTLVHKWKVTMDTAKNMKLYLDVGAGYVQKYSGPSNLSSVSALKFGYVFYNSSTTSKTMKTNFVLATRTSTQSNNNIVSMPATATNITTPAFTRTGEDGAMGCYVDPSPSIPLQFTTSNVDLGCVKAFGNNNPTSTSRRIVNTDEVPVVSGFYVTNGLIKLATTSTGVTFSAWTGSAYTALQTFTIGTIGLLKVLECGPEHVTFQTNTTKWTVRRGDQYCVVEHPNDVLTYTRKDTYDHDGTTTSSPAANADISMLTANHAEIYNSTDTYCVQIYKLNPQTIKSDSIPVDSVTGIGWFNNTLGTGDYNSKYKLPLQFPIQTQQRISLKQV